MKIFEVKDRQPARLWLLFFLVPLTVISLNVDIADFMAGKYTSSQFFTDFLQYIGLVGVYFYTFGIRCLHQYFWRIIFIFDFLDHVHDIFDTSTGYYVENPIEYLYLFCIFFMIIFYYFLLWRYAFSSPQIWQVENPQDIVDK
ncbi:hypothetical protein [Algicola sagamiensis]|uniref:hypothetical protein n=1 Tax=Algicola sagamiensis TaxID=163869 RepID=UPI0003611AE0|nr:hypothetical protein [Algicola sagamiensis]